jgi:carbon storage regulator
MLVFTRCVGESVLIGKNMDIKVTILEAKGKQVRVGILADKRIPIHREEIWERIQEEQQGNNNGTGTKPGVAAKAEPRRAKSN